MKNIATFSTLTLWSMMMAVDAFQLSMVASRYPGQRVLPRIPAITSPNSGATSGLISHLAVMALKRRLRDHSSVDCDVNVSSSDLILNGKVGPVTVKGRGWQSRLGLTCRAIEATVGKCDLDMGRVISTGKLVLNSPAEGDAMVAMNAADFGSFITHPLMKAPGLSDAEAGEGIKFLRDGVEIDASSGKVVFLGDYMGERWQCILRRGPGKALLDVVPLDTEKREALQDVSEELTSVVSSFFNEMVFELHGTFLSFRDMMLTEKGGVPTAILALGIKVTKFPSSRLEF